MRLAQAIASLDERTIKDLAHRVVPGALEVAPALWPHHLESVLRDSGQVEESLVARRPPVLAVIVELLESDGYTAEIDELRAPVEKATEEWCELVGSGEILGRDDQCRVYRRLLAAAWQNDLVLDPSETALLGLLRRELGMTQVEHFLMCHHPDIQPFWRNEAAFEMLIESLVMNGIVFRVSGQLVLAEELVPHIRRAAGIEMNRASAQRLFGRLGNADLKKALEVLRLKSSGSKPDRIERLIVNMAPASTVLDAVHIQDLRELARKVGAQISGSKEELMLRLVEHFEVEQDLASAAEPAEDAPAPEPRELDQARFLALFANLKGHQLKSLLMKFGLKHSGAKENKVGSLWDSHLSEQSILSKLKNPELDELLKGLNLKTSGSKETKIRAVLDKFSSEAVPDPAATDTDAESPRISEAGSL